MPRRSGIRFAVAALMVGALLVAPAGAPQAAPLRSRTTEAPDAKKPPITWKRIPFGERRKRQMGAYSKRHYGVRRWRLLHPRVIVEHYTGGTSFSAAWNTFASNAKHLGEYPGTCAHFIIDADGTIYQLVPLWIRCRHAMGMNWVAFGIEHVGTSDADVMGDDAEIASSYALTVWLMQRYGIQVRNVIGHAENLISPYHVEHVAEFACQTHDDFTHADMRVYRKHAKALAIQHHVPVGPPPEWVDSDC